MVPEISSITDRIFWHFGQFWTICHFVIFCCFAILDPNYPKNQNFEKLKKSPRDIIILHKCNKSNDPVLYYSLDMEHNGCNCYFSFWAIFWQFTSLTARKIKIKKNGKKAWRYHNFTQVYMLYCSWDMACDRCNCYFSFWVLFWPFTPLIAQKTKMLKKWKKCLEISSFYICVSKIMTRWCKVLETWCVTDGRTDGRMDGWEKWHIEADAPPKNLTNGKTKFSSNKNIRK